MKRVDRSEMKAFISQNPGASTKELMKRFKLKNATTVYQVKNSMKVAGTLGNGNGNGSPLPQKNGTLVAPIAPVITTDIAIGDIHAQVNAGGLRTIVNGVPGKIVPWEMFNALTH